LSSAPAGQPLTLALQPQIAPLLQALTLGLAEQAPSEWVYANLWLFRREHAYVYQPGELPCIAGLAYDGSRCLRCTRTARRGCASAWPATTAISRWRVPRPHGWTPPTSS
jgi:hypothetical protein